MGRDETGRVDSARRRQTLRRRHRQGHCPESYFYKGFIRYDGRLHPGIHDPIIDEDTWAEANKAVGNGHEDDTGLRYKDDHVHLLKGILRCGQCGVAMTPYPSGKKRPDGSPYLYYACVNFSQEGKASACSVRMLPAREFEDLIKQVLSDLGSNPAVLDACVDAANTDAMKSVTQLQGTLARCREEIGRSTAGIRRIIAVIKEQDLLSDDIKEEYRQLVGEKERLQTLCEKLQFDIDHRRKRVLDVELIRRSLQDFERLVSLLPLTEQKELFQLLLREVEVTSLQPGQEGWPGEEGTLTAKVSSRGFSIRVGLSPVAWTRTC